MPHAATSPAHTPAPADVPALSPTMTDPEPDMPGAAGGQPHAPSSNPSKPASNSSPVLSPARSRRSSRSSSSAMTPGAELPLPPLAAVGAALGLSTPKSPKPQDTLPRDPEQLEYLDDTAFSPFPNLPPLVSLPPLQAHPGSPWARATSPRPPRSPQPQGIRTPSPQPPATSPPPPPASSLPAPTPQPGTQTQRAKPALTLPLPSPTLDLSQPQTQTPDTTHPPGQLSNTPTAELGPFEYPVPEPDTPAAKRAASGPVPPHANGGTQQPSKPRPKHRTSSNSSTSPSAVAPAAPTRPLPRPAPRARRGSIASGQISRLSAQLEAWPGPARANSSPVLGQARESDDTPRPTRAPSFTSTSTPQPPSPTRTRAKHARSASGSQTHARRSSTEALQRPQLHQSQSAHPAHPATSPSHRLTPAAPRRGGVIAFSHTPLPAPIPPSLLARRGSVPANILPTAGQHRQWESVYHPPQRPSHARRMSQGRGDGSGSSSAGSGSGSGPGSGYASGSGSGHASGSASAGLATSPPRSALGTSPPTAKPRLKQPNVTRSPNSPMLDIPLSVHEDEGEDEEVGGGGGGALGLSPPTVTTALAARRRSEMSGQRPRAPARDGAVSG